MDHTSSFSTITEFGVALAGFSALAAALTQKPGRLTLIDRFRTINLLVWALVPSFVSLFPSISEAFGVTGAAAWRATSLGLVAIVVAVFFYSLWALRSFTHADRAALSPIMAKLFYIGHPLVAGANLVNAMGIMGAPGPGPILVSLVWLLFMAAVQLVRIVVTRPIDPTA